ncbi:CRS2-associated factor 1, chloroplastic [Linum perenne]
MALKLLQIPFPITAPLPTNPTLNLSPSSSEPHRLHSTTVLRFPRWNNAIAREFKDRHRWLKEIEDDSRRGRRFGSSDAVDWAITSRGGGSLKSALMPSSPPGRGSKPEDPKSAHPAFRQTSKVTKREQHINRKAEVKLSEDGLSYVINGAPFEFKYSYTESSKVKPLKLREPPFSPFGPMTTARPWTGRAPLPPSKKKLKEFDSFQPPPPNKKGVKPVQPPGPFLPGTGPRYVNTREEILGEPLTKEEIKSLVEGCVKSRRQMNIGRDGLTHNMLDNIHAHWKRKRVCKIKCMGVCTVDLDNVCDELEQRTGGKIIYRKGGVLYLFRGRNYNYRTRLRLPLMLWKPAPPAYPRLVQRAPAGLTLNEASEMRKKGRSLIPICKLGKNGVYSHLADNVREAFEECELVRINCQGMNGSDFRRIGAKLRDIVPCELISFETEHILLWRGRDWKSSLMRFMTTTDVKNDEGPSKRMSILKAVESLDSPAMMMSEEQTGITSKAEVYVEVSGSTKLHVTEPTSLDPSSATSLEFNEPMIGRDMRDPTLVVDTSNGNEVSESRIDSCYHRVESSEQGTSEETHERQARDWKSLACVQGVIRLLREAVENGAAILLKDDELDADTIRKRTVGFSQSATPCPIFQYRRRRRKEVGNTGNEESGDSKNEYVSAAVVSKNEQVDDGDWLELAGETLEGSLGVDELAKLLW